MDNNILYWLKRIAIQILFLLLMACQDDAGTGPATTDDSSSIDDQQATTTDTQVQTDVTIAAPTLNYSEGAYSSNLSLMIGQPTNHTQALIYYTLDGSDPSVSNGILYSAGAQIPITKTTTIKLFATDTGEGYIDSEIVSVTYTIDKGQLPVPYVNTSSGPYQSGLTVQIMNNSNDDTVSIIYTTNGTAPSLTNGTTVDPGTNAVTIPIGSTTTLRAILVGDGYTPSEESNKMFTIYDSIATPTFDIGGGIYSSPQTVTITSATEGAKLRIKTYGGDPTPTDGTEYDSPAVVTVDTLTDLKAIAYIPGLESLPSDVSSASYVFDYGPFTSPIVTPASGNFANDEWVFPKLENTTSKTGYYYRYTLTGTDPSATCGTLVYPSQNISGIRTENETVEFRARAIRFDYSPSAVASSIYTIGDGGGNLLSTPPDVWAHIEDATFSIPQDIYLHTSWPAKIYYTVDGSEPTADSTEYTGTPIRIADTVTLKFIAIDAEGASSNVVSNTYTYDANVPGFTVADISNRIGETLNGNASYIPVVTNFTSAGTVYFNFSNPYPAGTVAGSSTVEAGQAKEFQGQLNNSVGNYYLSFVDSNNQVATAHIRLPKIDVTNPTAGVDSRPGLYCGTGVNITVSFKHEMHGMKQVYYTVDGSDPSLVTDDTSGNCDSAPYFPAAGHRCALSNIYKLPTLSLNSPTSCIHGENCEASLDLKLFMIDQAGLEASETLSYTVDK